MGKKKKQRIALDDFKARREKAGLRQIDLAHLLSTRTSRISQIENGVVEPTVREVVKLSLIYGQPLEVLVAGATDDAAYDLTDSLGKLPKVSASWKQGHIRAGTLSDLAKRLAGYSNRRA